MFIPQEVIAKKRDNCKLNDYDISHFIKGIVDQSISDAQISALAMAIVINGFDNDETTMLTQYMRESGIILDWKDLYADSNIKEKIGDKPVVDKHSTGGIGDSVSLPLAPILAYAGLAVPMIAGRGLGFTGGTIDKLESIPGYNPYQEITKFQNTVADIGCGIIAQTKDIATADSRFYAVRDTTATVESIPLITSSILSKKLAEGLDYLILDVKCGSGAFMKTEAMANILAHSLINTAKSFGVKATAFITSMNQPLSSNIGNSLEILEVIQFLKNDIKSKHLHDLTKRIAIKTISDNLGLSPTEAEAIVNKAISGGYAFEIFIQMLHRLGVATEDIEGSLPKATLTIPIYHHSTGYIQSIDNQEIGMSLIRLGGGRLRPSDVINYSVGFESVAKIGQYVDENTPLAIVHCNKNEDFEDIKAKFINSFKLSDNKTYEIDDVVISALN